VIDFSQQTYQNILQDMLDRIPDTYDKRDTSPIQTALGPAAYTVEGFYLSLDRVQQMAFVQTASGQSLNYLSAIGGLTRYPASAAVRLGVFNAPVPIGSRFSTINGADSINFIVTAATEENGRYQLTAETAGVIGNGYTGAILPITTISGLTSAQITDILVPGDDEETDDSLRSRLITVLNERAFGGNIAAYRENILAIDGVGAVQVYPTWNGGGTVKCSIMGADYLPASATLVENVQNAIDPRPNQGLGLGLAPIGANVTICAPTEVKVTVSASVTLAAGYNLDQVTPMVKSALESYMLSARKSWGDQLGTTEVKYAANVYISRVLAAIVGTTGIINAVSVQLNGKAEDLILTESGTVQQVPVLGTVTLSA
jgi:uncharacterized phage protein gp47/JayE